MNPLAVHAHPAPSPRLSTALTRGEGESQVQGQVAACHARPVGEWELTQGTRTQGAPESVGHVQTPPRGPRPLSSGACHPRCPQDARRTGA